jgi:uroporphyrinogen-III synthase
MKAPWLDRPPAKEFPAPVVEPSDLHRLSVDESPIVAIGRIAQRLLFPVAPLDDLLTEFVESAATVRPCDSCLLYLLEDGDFVLRASTSVPSSAIDRLRWKSARAIGWLDSDRYEPIVLSQEAYRDPRCQLFSADPGDGAEVFVSLPVISNGCLVGLLNLYNGAEPRFDQENIEWLSLLTSLLGVAIDRARLQSENCELVEQLETRKLIERAKGILQRDLQLSEEAAYLTLQRESRNRRKTMKEVASAVIISDDLMHGR